MLDRLDVKIDKILNSDDLKELEEIQKQLSEIENTKAKSTEN
jgi:hypothetical protein